MHKSFYSKYSNPEYSENILMSMICCYDFISRVNGAWVDGHLVITGYLKITLSRSIGDELINGRFLHIHILICMVISIKYCNCTL